MSSKKTYLGAIIREYRTKNKVSVQKFSEACGLSKAYISMLERNERPDSNKPPIPSLEVIIAVAKAMDADTRTVMDSIGLNLERKEDECLVEPVVPPPTKSISTQAKPFQHIPLTQETLLAAIKERRIIILPFPAPRTGDMVWVPMREYGMAVGHTIEKAEGGVYTAYAESNGHITFSLYDINTTVYLSRQDAADALKRPRRNSKEK